jgi:hypothetical protein
VLGSRVFYLQHTRVVYQSRVRTNQSKGMLELHIANEYISLCPRLLTLPLFESDIRSFFTYLFYLCKSLFNKGTYFLGIETEKFLFFSSNPKFQKRKKNFEIEFDRRDDIERRRERREHRVGVRERRCLLL